MNSSTLKEKGFAEFVPLKGLSFSNLPLNKGSILVLADITLAGKSPSDILYIGKSKKSAKRIFGGYLAGYGGKASRKIHSMLMNDGYIEKVSISWIPSDDPKASQQELLDDYKKEYGDCPPWNLSKKNSVSVKATSPKSAKPRVARKQPSKQVL